MSDVPAAEVQEEDQSPVRFLAVKGAPPLGAVFGGIGLLAAVVVGLLGLDRIPVTFCAIKSMSGIPCATCGSTRAFARLFDLDLAGALAMNPFTTIVALGIAAWAIADAALLPRGKALRVSFSPTVGRWVRILAFTAFVVNWIYLLAVGR